MPGRQVGLATIVKRIFVLLNSVQRLKIRFTIAGKYLLGNQVHFAHFRQRSMKIKFRRPLWFNRCVLALQHFYFVHAGYLEKACMHIIPYS